MMSADTTIDTHTQDFEPENLVGEPVSENFPEIETDEQEQGMIGAIKSRANDQVTREARKSIIKGIEVLKEGLYSVDIEKTISDMFSVIKNMETQLESVLNINALLEKDLYEAREMISGLKKDKERLGTKIARMEEEAPSNRDLQIEIDHLTEEINKAQLTIRNLKATSGKLKEAVTQNQEKRGSLEKQRSDYIAEINILESQMNSAVEKLNRNQSVITALKGENLAYANKVKSLETELKESIDEKFELIKELKTSRAIMSELHAALTDKKIQAKKTFYRSQETRNPGGEE